MVASCRRVKHVAHLDEPADVGRSFFLGGSSVGGLQTVLGFFLVVKRGDVESLQSPEGCQYVLAGPGRAHSSNVGSLTTLLAQSVLDGDDIWRTPLVAFLVLDTYNRIQSQH